MRARSGVIGSERAGGLELVGARSSTTYDAYDARPRTSARRAVDAQRAAGYKWAQLGRKAIPNLEPRRAQLLQSLDLAHDTYYKSEVFGGPSLYFHQQALRASRDGDFDSFANQVY